MFFKFKYQILHKFTHVFTKKNIQLFLENILDLKVLNSFILNVFYTIIVTIVECLEKCKNITTQSNVV